MSDDTRTRGVEFEGVLDDVDFPVERADLLERHGDHDLGLEEGETTLGDVLERIDEDRFRSREDLREAVLTAVGVDAVGRAEYTDRGAGVVSGEDDTVDSF
ncbi:DUF5789 family protein [Halospeciosus flavus]|uniref:DUF5789 family protein n=1 Tax=Halospeciosus flavus TaxID=3032283 RepID=A0ABD5Z6R8_9EURY|nr:DUF5789 family protein [Halospeciosus flavus]